MNKPIIFMSFIIAMAFINLGMSTKTQIKNFRQELSRLQADNLDMEQKIKEKGSLGRCKPVTLSSAYALVINQVRLLESYSGTNMSLQLEGAKDMEDISTRFIDTPYKGIRGLKIRIIINKFSKETDMGAVLDDVHLLEKDTDFVATEISKDSNNLIIKGEVYGL